MKKNKKDGSEKNLDALFERLIKKAIEWEAERNAPDEHNLLNKKRRNKRNTGGEKKNN